MFKRYSILQRLSFVPFAQPKKNPVTGLEEAPAPVFHFNDDEVERLNTLWDSAWIHQASHDKDGVRLLMQDGESVHIQRDKITVSAKAEDASLRALVLHAKENWNNDFKPLFPADGNNELCARIWAQCQVHGVKFGWEPSPEMAKKMGPLMTHLRYEEAVNGAPSYGSEGLGYRPGYTYQEPVQIPRAGSRPNYGGLRAETTAHHINQMDKPAPSAGTSMTDKARAEALMPSDLLKDMQKKKPGDPSTLERTMADDHISERERREKLMPSSIAKEVQRQQPSRGRGLSRGLSL